MFDLSSQLYTSIDLGSSSIKVIIADVVYEKLNILGVGIVKTTSIKRGNIIDVESASRDIQKAIDIAKSEANKDIRSVYVAVPSIHTHIKKSVAEIKFDTKHDIDGRDIEEVIEEAKNLIYALPDSVYFDKILKLAEKNVSPATGTIIFNEKDLNRLPADFETKLNAIAVSKGGKLTVSKETRPIDGGFVLLYEGIDQNCSITSLFETNLEAVQDKVQKLLF